MTPALTAASAASSPAAIDLLPVIAAALLGGFLGVLAVLAVGLLLEIGLSLFPRRIRSVSNAEAQCLIEEARARYDATRADA